MKSRRLRNLILMISAPLLLFSFLYIIFILPPRLYNDWKLKAFVQSLEAISLPGDSGLVRSKTEFGALSGASNHCDAEVMLLVESSLEPSAFFSHFENEVKLALPYSEEPSALLSIYYVDEGELFQVNQEEWTLITDMSYSDASSKRNILSITDAYSPTEGKNTYIIRAWDQTFEGFAMNDLRCH